MSDVHNLKMNANKDFVILCFTDMHIKESLESFDNAMNVIKPLVLGVKPDLVVFNGDNFDGGVNDKLQIHLKKIMDFMDDNNQFYAFVMGNHDRDKNNLSTQNELLLTGGKLCLYKNELDWKNFCADNLSDNQKRHAERYGNYTISILDNDKLVYSLVMLDSGPFDAPNSPNNGYILDWQIEWFKNHIKTISGNDKYIPSMCFFHAHLPEFSDAVDFAFGKNHALVNDNKLPKIVRASLGFGALAEHPKNVGQNENINTGFFNVLKKYGCLYTFSGHNHKNNAAINYDGITMTYINKTGQNSNDGMNNLRTSAATVITIKNNDYSVELKFACLDKNGKVFYTQDFNDIMGEY